MTIGNLRGALARHASGGEWDDQMDAHIHHLLNELEYFTGHPVLKDPALRIVFVEHYTRLTVLARELCDTKAPHWESLSPEMKTRLIVHAATC